MSDDPDRELAEQLQAEIAAYGAPGTAAALPAEEQDWLNTARLALEPLRSGEATEEERSAARQALRHAPRRTPGTSSDPGQPSAASSQPSQPSSDPSEPTPEKDPAEWVTGDEPATGPQRSYLATLAQQAGIEVPRELTKAQASRLIDELQSRTGRGRSTG